MPTVHQHRSQAERNGTVAALLHEEGNYKEWAATALFYQALHLVNGFFLKKFGLKPTNHQDRQRKIEMLLRSIAFHYSELETAGKNARYECYRFSDAEINDLKMAVEEIRTMIEPQMDR